jgi:hypothetical protein
LRGVALAHACLILQSKQNRENEPAPDLIALYRQCLAVVNSPGSQDPREALLDRVLH